MSSKSPTPIFINYREFWAHYVSQHQHPFNQFLHAAGTGAGVICFGLAVLMSWKWVLIAVPLGYACAWLGHFLVERNRPLTFTYPLWSLIADYQLTAMLILRRPLLPTTTV
jgi:hypothetical protein